MGGAEVRPPEDADIRRLRPFAKALALIYEILPVFLREPDLFTENGHPFAAAADHELSIPYHTRIVPLHEAGIPIKLFESPGIEHADIGPAYGAVHGPHIEVHTAGGGDLRKPSATSLPVVDILQVLAGEGGEVKEIGRGLLEDLGITGPAVALPGGTVGGDIQMIALSRPDSGIHQPVDQRMGTAEETCLPEVRIDCDGGKVIGIHLHIALHQHILEAEYGESGLIFVQALPAGIIDPLQGSGLLSHGQLDIGLSEFAVFIQHLAEPEQQLLPRLGFQPEGQKACDVLTKVQHCLAGGGDDHSGSEMLVLCDGHIV